MLGCQVNSARKLRRRLRGVIGIMNISGTQEGLGVMMRMPGRRDRMCFGARSQASICTHSPALAAHGHVCGCHIQVDGNAIVCASPFDVGSNALNLSSHLNLPFVTRSHSLVLYPTMPSLRHQPPVLPSSLASPRSLLCARSGVPSVSGRLSGASIRSLHRRPQRRGTPTEIPC